MANMTTLNHKYMLLCVVFVACGGHRQDSESTLPPISSNTGQAPQKRPAGAGPFAKVAGAWEGTGLQDHGGTWKIVMVLQHSAAAGQVIGKIDYPSLSCGGKLLHKASPPGQYRFEEVLTYGKGNCIDGGTIQVWPVGDRKLRWYWHLEGRGWAKSMLRRR